MASGAEAHVGTIVGARADTGAGTRVEGRADSGVRAGTGAGNRARAVPGLGVALGLDPSMFSSNPPIILTSLILLTLLHAAWPESSPTSFDGKVANIVEFFDCAAAQIVIWLCDGATEWKVVMERWSVGRWIVEVVFC